MFLDLMAEIHQTTPRAVAKEIIESLKLNTSANRPLYLCRISVSDSSLVKVCQRVDRPPTLLLDVSSLLCCYFLLLGIFDRNCQM